jgi:hypothetical protein
LQDIKREIPRPVDLSRPSFTSFSCEMICNGQCMKPVKTQYDIVRGESVRGEKKMYIAVEDMPFEIKCTVRHNSGSNIQYGGEVFVDKGEFPIVSFAESRGQNSGPRGNRSNFVSDSPDLDHIFWFGPGETEYTIHGFFVDPETEQRFSFAAPPKQDIRNEDDPRSFQEHNKKIGWICIRFYQVDQLVDRSQKRPRLDSLRPKQGGVVVNATDPSSSEKAKLFAVSVRPGARVRTGPCTLKQACLLNHEDPIYESKINYAAMDAMWTLNTEVFASPSAWGGAPLTAFGRADTRTRCIRCAMSYCEHAPTRAAPSHLGQGVTVSEASHSREPVAVAVRDVVAAMDTILSRAASYMVCTGVAKPGNYGESLVQGNPMRRWKFSQQSLPAGSLPLQYHKRLPSHAPATNQP